MSGPVTVQSLLDIAPLLRRLKDLDDEAPGSAFLDGDLAIKHHDGWLIGTAVYQDDQWWVDFTNYGADLPADDSKPEETAR